MVVGAAQWQWTAWRWTGGITVSRSGGWGREWRERRGRREKEIGERGGGQNGMWGLRVFIPFWLWLSFKNVIDDLLTSMFANPIGPNLNLWNVVRQPLTCFFLQHGHSWTLSSTQQRTLKLKVYWRSVIYKIKMETTNIFVRLLNVSETNLHHLHLLSPFQNTSSKAATLIIFSENNNNNKDYI